MISMKEPEGVLNFSLRLYTCCSILLFSFEKEEKILNKPIN